MKALVYSRKRRNHFIYWPNNFAQLKEYPEYRNRLVDYEPEEDIVIPGEFL